MAHSPPNYTVAQGPSSVGCKSISSVSDNMLVRKLGNQDSQTILRCCDHWLLKFVLGGLEKGQADLTTIDAIDQTTITPVHGKFPDLVHYGRLPPQALVGSINGLLSGVLAYAGAQLFVEFLAEMRRPRDFFKVSTIPKEISLLVSYIN